jgi:diadenosine tetraphosphate (Ap4A) HIT family hydrolase
VRAVGIVARKLGLQESGYRVLANHGAHAHQEVPHFHVHIFGGQRLGRMIQPLE